MVMGEVGAHNIFYVAALLWLAGTVLVELGLY